MKASIEVAKQNETTFRVTVRAGRTTEHTVTLEPAYYKKLTGSACSPEALLEASFKFLLERESNSMILSHFDLPLIGHYFPGYESEIRKRVST